MNKKQAQDVVFLFTTVRDTDRSFTSFIDENGNEKFLVQSRDAFGKITKKRFTLQGKKGKLVVKDTEVDFDGKSVVDFLRDCSLCYKEGGVESEAWYYEYNPKEAAHRKVEVAKAKNQATTHALALVEKDLDDVAAYLGVDESEDNEIKKAAVLNFAESKPSEYNLVASGKGLAYMSIAANALNKGFLKKGKFGVILTNIPEVEEMRLGKDVKEAAETLANDLRLADFLREKIEFSK